LTGFQKISSEINKKERMWGIPLKWWRDSTRSFLK
jgi:hypothetical protein